MEYWYKYLPFKYARRMVEDGAIKIGTLFGYRNIEKAGLNIGDMGEGKLVKYSHDRNVRCGSELNEHEKLLINAGPGMIFADLSVAVTHESTDVYLYCMSRVFDTSVMTRMSTSYDSCVRINDPVQFVEEVKKSFCDIGSFLGSFPCFYMSRHQNYAVKTPHPALVKDFRDEDQQETRIIWDPKSRSPISQMIINVPGITRLCELYYLKDGTGQVGNCEYR